MKVENGKRIHHSFLYNAVMSIFCDYGKGEGNLVAGTPLSFSNLFVGETFFHSPKMYTSIYIYIYIYIFFFFFGGVAKTLVYEATHCYSA